MKLLLFLFALNIFLAEFNRMLWFIILKKYKFLTHKSYSNWDHVILQYVVIAGLIHIVLYLVKIPKFTFGEAPPIPTIAELP